MSRLLISVELVGEDTAAFTDAFNEWARHPDIDALMERTTDTPTGDPESDYSFEPPAASAPKNCPTCGSPAPHRHPAVQFEGEVQPCRDGFHLTVTPENTPERIAEAQALYRSEHLANVGAALVAAKTAYPGGSWGDLEASLKAIRDADYERGFLDGIAAYAYTSSEQWAENGVQYVGTTATTLRQAKEQVRETWNFAP